MKIKQKITAASDAIKGSAGARIVTAAPAKAEDRLGRVCEWTICGSFETSISNHNHHPVISNMPV
jgi:hypothetical protein